MLGPSKPSQSSSSSSSGKETKLCAGITKEGRGTEFKGVRFAWDFALNGVKVEDFVGRGVAPTSMPYGSSSPEAESSRTSRMIYIHHRDAQHEYYNKKINH